MCHAIATGNPNPNHICTLRLHANVIWIVPAEGESTAQKQPRPDWQDHPPSEIARQTCLARTETVRDRAPHANAPYVFEAINCIGDERINKLDQHKASFQANVTSEPLAVLQQQLMLPAALDDRGSGD